jgi:hypothetical protein
MKVLPSRGNITKGINSASIPNVELLIDMLFSRIHTAQGINPSLGKCVSASQSVVAPSCQVR